MTCSKVYTSLCTTQLANAATLIEQGNAVIACRQEQALFEELADEIGAKPPEFVDIRNRAGWAENGGKSGPKMAALIAESQLPQPEQKTFDITSYGQCLITGPSEIALAAASQLAESLSVTVLLDTQSDAPLSPDFDIIIGRLKSATGTLSNFKVRLDALQIPTPGGRGETRFSEPKDGAISHCEIILDLSGNTALFSTPDKRDGYLRADPRVPAQVSDAVFKAAQMTGTFEKPLYVAVANHICAHSRAQITGCSNCINACLTGAITPDGDHVTIDPMICAGCGACAALCPSGAITFEAPPTSFLIKRIETLAQTYLAAGGKSPRLLVCDETHGAEMIALSARYGRGLPSDVIPLEISALTTFGHAEMLAALALGFVAVDLLLSPKTESDPLEHERALAQAIAKTASIRMLDITDPDALSDALYGQKTTHKAPDPILPIGDRRQITRLAATALNGKSETPILLPQGAPYGKVNVDQDACTLCLSCVSLCPSGAIMDNPDAPQLKFQEDACLQCGLCTRACPENAITLQPQLNLSDSALSQVVLNEEAPFACISCGSLFGVKSTIDKIIEKLEGKHPMFAESDSGKLIQMCDKCRVETHYHATDNPFQSKTRPPTRTTADYLKRRDH